MATKKILPILTPATQKSEDNRRAFPGLASGRGAAAAALHNTLDDIQTHAAVTAAPRH